MQQTRFALARLREAREARGLSLEDLAKRMGTTRQFISRCELGRLTPRADTVERFCAALDVPPDFFLRPTPQPELTPIFFRHFRSKTKAKHRVAAATQLTWVQQCVELLDRYVVLTEPDVPDLHPRSDPRDIPDEEIEGYAQALRRHWKLGDGVIPNVVALLEQHGCIVVPRLVAYDTIDAFSQWTMRGRPYIIMGSRDSGAARRRMDAAHELGHLVLHRAIDKRFVEANPDTHSLIEKQAFRFAGAFLMPAVTFKQSLPTVTLDTLLFVKLQWKASVASMISRAQTLGMVDISTASRLYRNLNRRGWKQREPFDDQMPVEEPQLLAGAIRALSETDPHRLDVVRAEIGQSAADLGRYCGVPPATFEDSQRVRLVPLRGNGHEMGR